MQWFDRVGAAVDIMCACNVTACNCGGTGAWASQSDTLHRMRIELVSTLDETELLADIRKVTLEEARDRTRFCQRAPPVSTHLDGQISYPLRSRKRGSKKR